METVYRCGQCSRLDKSPGTVVIVEEELSVNVELQYKPHNVTVHRAVSLCADCYKEIFTPYGT